MAALDPIPPHARQLETTAFWAARTNEAAALRDSVDRLQNIEQRWPNAQTRAASLYGRSRLALTAGDLQSSERLLSESLGCAPSVWALFDLADLFAKLGKPALAEEYWAKFDSRRGTILKLWFPGVLVWSWLNRAQAAVQRGDPTAAQTYAKQVLDHWATRNPQIGIVQMARNINVRTA